MAITDVVKKDVAKLYISAFGRVPDAKGFKFWLDSYEKGVDLYKMAMFHTQSEEYKKAYADVKTNADFVEKVYMNVLNRASDAEGKKFWVNALDKGMTKAAFLVDFIKGAQGDDVAQIANKADFGIYVAENNIPAENEKVQEQFKAITKDAKTLETAKNTVADLAVEVVEGETFTLTNKIDTFPAKEGDNKGADIIGGKVSGLLAESTLNAKDNIDGGEGADVLRVELKSNFSGFDSKVGGVKGVETIELLNKSKSAREFSAKGVEKAEEYVLKGNINLKDLDSVAKVALINRAQDFTVKFADKVTDGKTDDLALSLKNVGKADAHAKITANGIEKLSLTATGNNFVDNNTSASAIEVKGDGKLNFKTTIASVESFDASKATGDVVADLNNVTKLDSLSLGEGNDKAIIDASKTVADMVIAGGKGEDALVIKGTAKTVQYQMTGVENVELGALDTDMTFSATNTEGLEAVVASNTLNQDVKFVYLGEKDMTLQLKGANANTKTITMDNAGATKVLVDTPAANLTPNAFSKNTLNATLLNSEKLDLGVAEKMDYAGKITAAKATEATIAIKGKTTLAEIDAASAENINITEVANASTLKLVAAEALGLNVVAVKELDVSNGATKLGKLQTLNVNTQALFKTGALADLAQADLKGSGAVELGAIGGVTMEHGVAITAEGLKDIKNPAGAVTAQALKLAGITTKGEDINITTSNISGEVLLNGAISTTTTSGSVTLNLQASKVNGSAADITAIESLEATINSDSTASLKNLSAKEITLNIKALETATVGTIDAADKVSAEINANDAVTLGVVGGTAAPKEATITINTLEAAAFSGAITADKLELDLAGVMGGATFGAALDIKESLTLNGPKLKGFDLSTNTINAKGTALEATLNGGLEADKAKIALDDAKNTTKVTLKGDLGLGANTVEIDASAEADTAVTIDLSGFNAGMEGTVTIKAGQGDDVITLGSAKKHEVVFQAVNTNGKDTIKGFKSGDVLKLDSVAAVAVGGTGDDTGVNFKSAAAFTDANAWTKVNVFTVKLEDLTTAKLHAALTTAASVTITASDKFYVIATDGKDTGVYLIEDGGDTSIAAGEVKQIATLTGISDLATLAGANFTVA